MKCFLMVHRQSLQRHSLKISFYSEAVTHCTAPLSSSHTTTVSPHIMMDLRILLFFVTMPWIFCEPARTSKVVPKHKGILKVIDDEEFISESRIVMEAKKPKVWQFNADNANLFTL